MADDHPMIGEGLIAVLAPEDDLKVAGGARDGEEVCLLYNQLCPDILIPDRRIPKKDGLNDSGTLRFIPFREVSRIGAHHAKQG